MPVINRGVQPAVVSGGNFQAISLTGVTFSAGNWNGDTPGNLGAIADGNLATATTWGRTLGGGNRGWIQADLGAFYSRLYIEIKIGIKMEASWGDGNADWFCETSELANLFVPTWETKQFKPTALERILYLNQFVTCRYLRLGCSDNGGGQGMLQWYSLRAWQLNL